MSTLPATRELAPRSTAAAVLFSLLAPGLGHLYVGRGRRGVVLLALTLTYIPAMFLLSRLPASAGVLTGLGCIVGFHIGLLLFGVMDAWRLARGVPAPYEARPYNSFGLYLLLIFLSFGLAGLGTGWLISNAFEAYVVPSRSMAPTIAYGDRILVRKGVPDSLERGMVIVFRAPDGGGRSHIKRIVGLPGETIRVGATGGAVWVDGERLPRESADAARRVFREHAGDRAYTVQDAGEDGEMTEFEVPTGALFVLGDNRDKSKDSRAFGPVAIGSVIGIAEYTIWSSVPPSRFGLLP